MAERGAIPQVPMAPRRALRLISSFTSPLLPDDYLELVNPLWSTRELRGRVMRVERETPNAVTIVIKPGWRWPGHLPGQYVRLGVDVNGVRHWRAYSLTSEPGRADGCIAVTPKLVPAGKVSPFLCSAVRPGAIVSLGGVEGSFVLPHPLPARMLFVSAGSGLTPLMSMVRSLAARRALTDLVHVHSSRTAKSVLFAAEMSALARRNEDYRLHVRLTGKEGRLTLAQLERICPDWRERDTFACGPSGLLAAIRSHWGEHGDPARLHIERFAPDEQVGEGERGRGGEIDFTRSGVRAESDGSAPILAAGEAAGAQLPYGCRMGICHSCVGRLRCGRVRDLRTGEVHGSPGELLRTCVNAPEGAIEIEL